MSVSRPQPVPLHLLGWKLQKLQTSRARRYRLIAGRTPLHLELLVDKLPEADELVLEKQSLRKLDHFFISDDLINNLEGIVEDQSDRQSTSHEEVLRQRLTVGRERFSVLEHEVRVRILRQKKAQVALTSLGGLIPDGAQKRFQFGVNRLDKLRSLLEIESTHDAKLHVGRRCSRACLRSASRKRPTGFNV